ncbi:MAG: outer membrane protein transport protein [Myxococcota bacterium]
MHRRSAFALILGCMALLPQKTLATTEIPALFDGRPIGMAGAAAALVDNATAVYENPAAMDQIEYLSVTAGVSPFRPENTVPLEGPNTAKSTSAGFFPLFFAGGAYRLAEPLVVGLGIYPVAGTGAQYSDVSLIGGEDLEFGIVLLEASMPVSVRLTKWLSVAMGWRVTFMNIQSSNIDPGSGAKVTQDLRGTDVASGQLALHLRPYDWLKFGLVYRSKMSIKGSGSTDVGPQSFDTDAQFSQPHALRLGVAATPIANLNVAADVRYLFYEESNKNIRVTTQTPAGSMTQVMPQDWQNVASVHLGAEYYIRGRVAVRLGYSATGSATPKHAANPFTTVNGSTHCFGWHGRAF